MNEFYVGHIRIDLSDRDGGILIRSPLRSVLIEDLSEETIIPVIEQNYRRISSFYLSRLSGRKDVDIDSVDIDYITVSILLYYLSMYNSWRIQYPNVKKYQDLSFREDDFDNPSTHDIIFRYFRSAYPESWEKICAMLLDMPIGPLREYYKRREQFYNQ